jgi:hypothetical protein
MGGLKARPSVQFPRQMEGRTAKIVDKRGRLVAWALVHRVHVDAQISPEKLGHYVHGSE